MSVIDVVSESVTACLFTRAAEITWEKTVTEIGHEAKVIYNRKI
ncbi:MAG TPA: hypothetical protein VMZ29_06300 [Candidatus Bathyarchaeia archaeon]|nr:hypothetical protein [Candidatus Bathyarchaeia archaeon]